MNRILISLLATIVPLAVSAQWRNPAFYDLRSGHEIGVYAQAGLASSTLPITFVYDLYTGQALDRAQREAIAKNSNGLQRGGADLDYGIFYRHRKDSVTKWGWMINVAERYHVQLAYTGNLFELGFLGNGSLSGQTADLGGSMASFIRMKQIQIGAIWKPSQTITVALGGSLMWGHQLAMINLDQGSVYTEPTGEYLDVQTKGSISYNAPGGSHYFNPGGFGPGFDLMVNYKKKRLSITFEARDMGFIRWNGNTTTQRLDTALTYSGINLDLFNSTGNILPTISGDSLINALGVSTQNGALTTMLPTSLMLEVEHGVGKKDLRLYGGLMYRFVPYFPYVYAGTRAGLGKGFGIDGRFAWGGAGSWNVGLALSKDFGKLVSARIFTYNLEGIVTLGTGVSYGVTLIFRP